jgi:hypothetical protein
MKTSLFFVLASLFLFGGCSTTHYLKYAKSDKAFYDDYNNSAGHKEIKVSLAGDSVLYTDDHSLIKNDTLYVFEKESEAKNYVLPTTDIKDIYYISNDYKTAVLVFDDGEKIRAENISINVDTISFGGIRELLYKEPLVPLNQINTVTYKNHWRGVINGTLGGILLGGGLGATGWIFKPPDGHGGIDRLGATIGGALSGLIIGGVVGYLIGFDVNYQFSPGK